MANAPYLALTAAFAGTAFFVGCFFCAKPVEMAKASIDAKITCLLLMVICLLVIKIEKSALDCQYLFMRIFMERTSAKRYLAGYGLAGTPKPRPEIEHIGNKYQITGISPHSCHPECNEGPPRCFASLSNWCLKTFSALFIVPIPPAICTHLLVNLVYQQITGT